MTAYYNENDAHAAGRGEQRGGGLLDGERTARVGKLRAAGNTIVPQLAAAFIAAVMAGCSPTMPPARYDRPFRGHILVQDLPGHEANTICQAHKTSRSGSVAGCSFLGGKGTVCHVIINRHALYDRAALIRHEVAHCNGWSQAHED